MGPLLLVSVFVADDTNTVIMSTCALCRLILCRLNVIQSRMSLNVSITNAMQYMPQLGPCPTLCFMVINSGSSPQ